MCCRNWTITGKARGQRPIRAGAGFTIIEIMVTLTVLGVLITVALPSITKLIQDSRIRSQANDLMTSLAIARSESAKQGVRVTVCTSSNYTSCNGGGASAWKSGYILFADVNANGTVDAGDTVLRIGDPLSGRNTLVSSGFNAPAAADTIQFRPSGNTNLPAAGGSFKLCDSRVGSFGRLITLGVTGRTSSTPTACP
jgi:type IV fimbrial biogenesis protein FimT